MGKRISGGLSADNPGPAIGCGRLFGPAITVEQWRCIERNIVCRGFGLWCPGDHRHNRVPNVNQKIQENPGRATAAPLNSMRRRWVNASRRRSGRGPSNLSSNAVISLGVSMSGTGMRFALCRTLVVGFFSAHSRRFPVRLRVAVGVYVVQGLRLACCRAKNVQKSP